MQNEVTEYSPNHFKKVIPKKSYKKPSAHFIKQDNLMFGIVIAKNRVDIPYHFEPLNRLVRATFPFS